MLPAFLFAQKGSLHQKLNTQYEQYQEKSITNRRFKHGDIIPLIKNLSVQKGFETKILGKSYEGREIYQVKIGSGNKKILLWSQMHGDEPTATMAIADIFNFLSAKDDGFDDFRERLLSESTLYFIPLLNPDGAEQYQRRNAQDIDLNRDALRAQTPEGKILKDVVKELKPDFGFNLHDQSRYYSAGNTPNPATMSFLAPAFNYEKDINRVREKSMQLIIQMNKILQAYIPDHVAKYSDDFEPRAFGDNIQKWGTSTILIEAGGLRGDREKQEIRKLHFLVLLEAFESIISESYAQNPLHLYEQIPNNERKMKEFILKNAILDQDGRSFKTDIAFKVREIQDVTARHFYDLAYIDDLGDLSIYYGYEEFDADTYIVRPGKTYTKVFRSSKQIYTLDLIKALREGYTDFIVQKLEDESDRLRLPVRIHLEGEAFNNKVYLGNNPSLIVYRKGIPQKAIVNGRLISLEQNARD